MDKSQIMTKKDDAKDAKVWALSERYDQVTHLRAPLDSTAIDPKPGLPTKNMRPVKEKTYQEQTFALRNPLELDDDDLDLLKLEHLCWLRSLGEASQIAPPYSTMGKPLLGISSLVHYLQMEDELQAYDIFEMAHLESWLLIHDDDHHLTSSSHGLYESFF